MKDYKFERISPSITFIITPSPNSNNYSSLSSELHFSPIFGPSFAAMHMSIFFTLSALLSASLTSAQEVLAEVMIYGAEDCGKDPNNPDLVSQSITVFKDVSEIKVVDGKPQGGCMSAMSEVPDWPTNSQGQYLLSVDENTIPKDCSLVVYTDLPDDAESGPGVCGIFYRRVPSDGTCTSFNIKPHFGYA